MRRGFAPIVIVPIISIVLILGLYASNKFLGIEYPWQPEFGYEQDLYRSAQTTPSPTSSTNETVYTDTGSVHTEDPRSANWKTYENQEFSFLLAYPQNWGFRSINPMHIEISSPSSPQDIINIYVWNGKSGLGGWCEGLETKTENIRIGEHTGRKDTCGGNKIEELALIFRQFDGDKNVQISAYISSELDLINQILSTFKFLE